MFFSQKQPDSAEPIPAKKAKKHQRSQATKDDEGPEYEVGSLPDEAKKTTDPETEEKNEPTAEPTTADAFQKKETKEEKAARKASEKAEKRRLKRAEKKKLREAAASAEANRDGTSPPPNNNNNNNKNSGVIESISQEQTIDASSINNTTISPSAPAVEFEPASAASAKETCDAVEQHRPTAQRDEDAWWANLSHDEKLAVIGKIKDVSSSCNVSRSAFDVSQADNLLLTGQKPTATLQELDETAGSSTPGDKRATVPTSIVVDGHRYYAAQVCPDTTPADATTITTNAGGRVSTSIVNSAASSSVSAETVYSGPAAGMGGPRPDVARQNLLAGLDRESAGIDVYAAQPRSTEAQPSLRELLREERGRSERIVSAPPSAFRPSVTNRVVSSARQGNLSFQNENYHALTEAARAMGSGDVQAVRQRPTESIRPWWRPSRCHYDYANRSTVASGRPRQQQIVTDKRGSVADQLNVGRSRRSVTHTLTAAPTRHVANTRLTSATSTVPSLHTASNTRGGDQALQAVALHSQVSHFDGTASNSNPSETVAPAVQHRLSPPLLLALDTEWDDLPDLDLEFDDTDVTFLGVSLPPSPHTGEQRQPPKNVVTDQSRRGNNNSRNNPSSGGINRSSAADGAPSTTHIQSVNTTATHVREGERQDGEAES